MAIFAVSRMKSQPFKLRDAVNDIEQSFNPQTIEEISKILDKLISAFNKEKYSKIREQLCSKLYTDNTVQKIIYLMPVLSQELINKISTLFQNTIRECPQKSLASYLMVHDSALKQLFSYTQDYHLCSTASILLKELITLPFFNDYILDLFIKYFPSSNLFSNNFEICASSFCILKTFLTKNPGVTSKLTDTKYSNTVFLLLLLLQQLLLSKAYMIKALTLDLITSIFIESELNGLKKLILCESEIMKNLMILMHSKSKRIATMSYHLFKHFVVFNEKTETEKNYIINNKLHIIKFLRRIDLSDTDEEVLEERQAVISFVLLMK